MLGNRGRGERWSTFEQCEGCEGRSTRRLRRRGRQWTLWIYERRYWGSRIRCWGRRLTSFQRPRRRREFLPLERARALASGICSIFGRTCWRKIVKKQTMISVAGCYRCIFGNRAITQVEVCEQSRDTIDIFEPAARVGAGSKHGPPFLSKLSILPQIAVTAFSDKACRASQHHEFLMRNFSFRGQEAHHQRPPGCRVRNYGSSKSDFDS